MTLHADLLAQARHLARKEPTRPKQASLRRAISTAYYALFHLLTLEASRVFVGDQRILTRMNRAYGHNEMYEVSQAFARGDWPKLFDTLKGIFFVSNELKQVAQAFVDLQQARHVADYDLSVRFTRGNALDLVERAEDSFRNWQAIRNDDLTRIYLGCFLLWKQWDRTR